MRFVSSSDIAELLPMGDAIDALQDAFASGHLGDAPQRTHVDVPDGTLLLMPASGDGGVGVKLVTLNPSNPDKGLPFIHGVYVLFSAGSLEPEVIVDGGAMTGLRTAAVSGLATRHLARADATRLVLFGAGTQGHAHLDAMLAVRSVTHVTVVSRSAGPAEELASRARDLGLEAEVGAPSSVSDADIVCTCTTSPVPVFDGSLLPDGCHVNAVGAYTTDTRELDDITMRRAKIVVEDRDAALAEAGDVVIPLESGAIDADRIVADLSEVVTGAAVRTSDADITVFKSVGVAFEDLAVARALVDRLER